MDAKAQRPGGYSVFQDLCGASGCHVRLTWGGAHPLRLDQGPPRSSLPPTPEGPKGSSDTAVSQLTPSLGCQPH